ncbi:unnamed protein product, partial [marine sediment metagenome]
MSSIGDARQDRYDGTSTSMQEDEERWAPLRRRVRLIMLLHASESAGLAPIGILQLHSLAYLSNVLSPVWELRPLDGKVMKRRGGPFYPALQHDLDGLVSQGLVLITNLGYERDDYGRWRLDGAFHLNHNFADAVIRQYRNYEAEYHLATFIDELAFAFSALSEEDLQSVASEDATYADQLTSFGNVVDFGEWQTLNYSANAANYFDRLLSGGTLP